MTRCKNKSSNSCLDNNIKCNSHLFWKRFGNHIQNYFEKKITVLDLMNKIDRSNDSYDTL